MFYSESLMPAALGPATASSSKRPILSGSLSSVVQLTSTYTRQHVHLTCLSLLFT